MTNINLTNKIAHLESVITDLKNEIQEMKIHFENEIKELKEKRNEIYYQNFLEKYMKATHKKTKFGITDISTDSCHIEIKHWRHYKSALGQLLSYNHYDNKELAAYFYGSVPEHQRNNIIELYRSKNVSIYEFMDSLDGIQIKEVLNTNKQYENENNYKLDFYEWLNGKIMFYENGYMSLEEICSSFLKKENLHSSIKCKYRVIIEKFIKETFKEIDVKWKYQDTWDDEKYCKGWKNVIFVDKDDSFIKFLDENVEYKDGEVLKLSDVCERFLGKTIHSSKSSVFRKKIEKYIKLKYDNLKWEYDSVNINGKTYKGWKHFTIKDV